MPVKMDDAAEHISAIPDRKQSMHAMIDTIVSGLKNITDGAALRAFIADIEQSKNRLVNAVEANLGGVHRGRLGPGETPNVHDDGTAAERISADEAEALGNPAIGRDMGGHKMHPADAFAQTGGTAQVVDRQRSADFGGSGAQLQPSGGLLPNADTVGVDVGSRSSEQHTETHVEPITGDTIVTTFNAAGDVLNVERKPKPVNGPVS